jgi:methionine synthase / methylenetetrahydrofolate reductase(NADPH)
VDIPFLQALASGGLVADGAMGSLLYERGVFVNRNFDEVNLSQPELVYKIHREYLLAGAHLLESNTYGANRVRLARHGLGEKVTEINRAAMSILVRAAGDAAYLAGSMGPTGLTPGELRRHEKDVREAYAEQARLLAEGGAHVVLIETFAHPAELRLAVEAARSATKLPIVAHITVNNEGHIADGSDPLDIAREMKTWGADVVGVNCNGPEVVHDVALRMVESGLPVSAMPNAGRPQSIEDRLIYLATPENFGVFARRMYKAGVKLVGGCCGTSPAHIGRVAAAARMVSPRPGPQARIEVVSEGREPKPVAARSRFGGMLGRRFAVSVEVNPDATLSLDAPLEAARTLLAAGADVINIADGPRATARVSNLALALHMQEKLGCEVLLHLTCRDHNLLGLQAGALGAHVMGIRNLVAITGDPPKVGDYPDATAVYDVDSVGLLKMLHGYNRGVDPSGKALSEPTSFVLATGVEPAAQDFERELLRLRQKIAAGADLVMTQPIYDPAHLVRFLDATADLKVPVLVGLLPLASYRNAEFIHNHIPGMGIPQAIRDRMQKAGKGAPARREGVAIAVETLLGVRQRVAGAYIMPPLGHFDMAAEIIAALGSDRSVAASAPGRVAP